ncbi:MAG: holo-ACP synthase [Acidobacteriota bacterium]|nr:holo-ACP synthase [Acidobacteriota bacterium]
MIYGIGIDTEIVGRVEKLLAEHGDYVGRIFTAGERMAAKKFPLEKRARFYASAFAGKEAVMKSLGTGWSAEVEWFEIETPIGDSGTAKLFGASAKFAEKIGVSRIFVSLSATSEFVAATAIAETD